jgi:catechol 2,3-dioxygenase-like lactoylglutathione lyase family enzyme
MITSVNHITLAVINVQKSFDFYKDVLGFKPLCKWDKGAYFLVGDLWFCLNLDENRVPNLCYTHYAFSVSEDDFLILSQQLKSSGVFVFKDNKSEGDSFYFLDPDGHKLEIHVGVWESRLKYKRKNLGTWQHVEWYI